MLNSKYKEFLLSTRFLLVILSLLKYFTFFLQKIPHLHLDSLLRNKKTVLSGSFKGLIWDNTESTSDTFHQKMLGVQEIILHKAIYEFQKNTYDQIISIGSSEGYYANGLALIFPNTKLLAIDINGKDIKKLTRIAKINSIKTIETSNENATKTLTSFDPELSYFIFSDIESFKFKVFNTNNVKNLINSDLIIEKHYKPNSEDFID